MPLVIFNLRGNFSIYIHLIMLILKYIYTWNYKPVHKINNVNNTLDDDIAISLQKQNIK